MLYWFEQGHRQPTTVFRNQSGRCSTADLVNGHRQLQLLTYCYLTRDPGDAVREVVPFPGQFTRHDGYTH